DLEARIDLALTNYFKTTAHIPQNETEFQSAMNRSGIGPVELRDPWGRPYYVTFKHDAIYGNRVTIYNYAKYGEKPKEKTELTPVTQQVNFIYLRSGGEDGKVGTYDDFNVTSFSRIIAEQAGSEPAAKPINTPVMLRGSSGAITVIVTDPIGAVVAGAQVTAKNSRTSVEYPATTGDDGLYIIKNLPAGFYQVTFDTSGFKRSVVTDVFVRSSNVTQLNVSLELGAVQESVTITAE